MRTHDGQVQGLTQSVSNAPGQFVGGFWTNPSPGRYEFYLTEPGAKFLAVSGTPNSSGAPLVIQYGIANNEQPPRAPVGFLTSAGATGGFGGSVQIMWRRGQA